MTILEKLNTLTDNEKILDFSKFVLAGLKNEELPNFSSLDFDDVPDLKPQLVIIDYRDGIEKGILVHRSGSKIDENFGHTLQGKYLEDTYTGVEIKYKLIEFFQSLYTSKRPFFISSCVHYEQDDKSWKYKKSFGLFFPCSPDGERIEFGAGLVDYQDTDQGGDQIFEYLTP